jgi:hypothetical protein
MTTTRFRQHQHALTRWYAAYCRIEATTGVAAAMLFQLHAAETEPLSPAYLQLSRKRLGLEDLKRWEGKTHNTHQEDVSDLPLFRGATL